MIIGLFRVLIFNFAEWFYRFKNRIFKVAYLCFLSSLIFYLSACNSSGTLGEPSVGAGPTEKSRQEVFNFFRVAVNSVTSVAQTNSTPDTNFKYEIFSGLGSVNPQGVFTAPATPGVSIVRVDSSKGEIFYVNVEIVANFVVLPAHLELLAGSTKQFFIQSSGNTASSDFTWSTNGGIISGQGVYTAPSSTGTYTITVLNSLNLVANAQFVVKEALALNQTSLNLNVGESFDFNASGGIGEYRFEIFAGNGQMDSKTGIFIAPTIPGQVIIRVQDSDNNYVLAVVTIIENLAINPKLVSVAKGSFFNFSALGGKPPYTFTVPSSLHGSITTTGLYSASLIPGVYQVKVADSSIPPLTSIGEVISTGSGSLSVNNLSAQVGETINFASSIISSSGNLGNFQLSAEAGIISGLNYTLPSTPGEYVVTVKDTSVAPPLIAKALVTAVEPLAISPDHLNLALGNSFRFSASGGIPPYTYSLQSGIGQMNSQGELASTTATGSLVVKVTDAKSHTAVSNVTIGESLSISPAQLSLLPNQSYQFSANGGVGAQYFSLVTGLGLITATGNYTAANSAGVALIEVRDEFGNKSQGLINIITPLSLIPSAITLIKNSSLTFVATGGSPPYTYKLVEANAGTISNQGVYNAPAVGGVFHLEVTDHSQIKATALITVYESLILQPYSTTLTVGDSATFTVAGGQAPFSFAVVETNAGSITPQGVYTAPLTAGTYHVEVKDQLNLAGQAEVRVVPALNIIPNTLSLAIDDSSYIQVNGGVPPYVFSVVQANGGSISANGLYTAPHIAGSFTVQVKDASDRMASLPVTVSSALSLTASSANVRVGQTKLVLANGGVGPYTYTVLQSNQGSVVGSGTIGTYTAPADLALGSVVTIAASDSLGHQSQLSLNLYEPLQIQPSNISVAKNNSKNFTASGGALPLVWGVSVNGGTITTGGYYTASSTVGTYSISLTDAENNQAFAAVTINQGIIVSPQFANLGIGGTQVFNISGGAPPYSYLLAGVGQFNFGTTSGTYSSSLSGNAQLQIADSLYNQIVVNIEVESPIAPSGLTLVSPASSPSNNQTPTVRVSGVNSGDTVKVYRENSCTNQIGSVVSTGTAADVNLSSLTEAAYDFYALKLTSAGNASNCSAGSLNYRVDITPPIVQNVTSANADGTYYADNGVGSDINIQVQFSEVINLSGTPQLSMNTGRGGAVANFTSVSSGSIVNFTYTVLSGDSTSDLDYTNSTSLTGGTFSDLAGNIVTMATLPNAGAANSLSVNKNIVLSAAIDTTAPTVANVTAGTLNGTLTTGTIPISIVFSEAVIVTGNPKLELNITPTLRFANYVSGSGTNTLVFNYVIALGDTANALDYTSISALTLNGGTIKDAANNVATLTLPILGLTGSLGVNNNIVINAEMPSVPANFFASTLDGQIHLSWTSCVGCTYEVFWGNSTGVTLSSSSLTGLTGSSYLHTGLTNGNSYYYKIRAVRAGVGASSLSSEVSAMPYTNICTTGDLLTTCNISGPVSIPDNYNIAGKGDINIQSGGGLLSNTGGTISLQVGGSLSVVSGGSINAGFALLRAANYTLASGATHTGDIAALSMGVMTVSDTLTGNIASSSITNLTINPGGVISANFRGYAAQSGTGAGIPSSDGSGAGYGGLGGRGNYSTTVGTTYGSLTNPINIGSGGGYSGGGTGGGALKLVVGGTLTNNGTISANGANATGNGGGGSGGSIWLDVGITNTGNAGVFTGTGSITGTGGNGSTGGGSTNGGGGGGGRIAIHSVNHKYRGTISVLGGNSPGANSANGKIGTYYQNTTNMDSLCDSGTMTTVCTLFSTLYLGDAFVVSGENYTVGSTGVIYGNSEFNLTGNLTINPGGVISANFRGYAAQSGTGAGIPSSDGSGAGYGGLGGRGNYSTTVGTTYGSLTNPINIGSGGGYSGGGTGGGALKLVVGGTLTNNGTISANGANATGNGGGGSGGSIWLDVGITNTGNAGVFTGTGSITGTGGNGSTGGGSTNGGGGGGGRIAIHSVNHKYRGTISVLGGNSPGANSANGKIGTYYQNTTNMNSLCDSGDLITTCTIMSNLILGGSSNLSGTNLTIASPGFISGSLGTLNLSGTLNINSGATFGADISNLVSSTVIVSGNLNSNIADSTITNLTINPGGQISADGRGYLSRTGAGAGSINGDGSGASHGGKGGRGNLATTLGAVYDSNTNPVEYGSGGGGSLGGSGGGALKLVVSGTLNNNGIISANGNNASSNQGGGSGGSVWIDVGIINTGNAGVFTGTGSIAATGGNGDNTNAPYYGGGGGGGRIAIYSVNHNFRGTVNVGGGAASGNGSSAGGSGSYYQNTTNMNSLCDSGTMAAGCTLSSSLYLGDSYMISGTDYTVASNGTIYGNISMNLSGSLTINSGGKISADGRGYVSQDGPSYGASSGWDGVGGTHGGVGGRGENIASTGIAYGSLTQPIDFGSGGGYGAGGIGGGALKVVVSGTLTNNGSITANGNNATSNGGGGAGGSIWIDVGIVNAGSGVFSGTGSITAKGGNGSTGGAPYYGGGGGGGRIAVYSVDYNYRGSININGGADSSYYFTPGSAAGEVGTFYQYISNSNSLCDSGDLSTNCIISTSRVLGDGVQLTGTNLQIQNGGNIYSVAPVASSQLNLTGGTFAIDSGGIFNYNLAVLKTNTFAVSGQFSGNILDSLITGNLTINSGATLSANGKGFAGGAFWHNGYGINGGTYNSNSGGGGGYGGAGGRGSNASATGGTLSGASVMPVYMGSGGAAGGTSAGGSGGGVLKFLVSGTTTVDGTLAVNGGNGAAGGGNGGGAGGSLWLKTTALAGGASGIISANGGAGSSSGSNYGGGGGGGRIAIYYTTNTFAGTSSVIGGAASGGASVAGGDGTVYTTGAELSPQLIFVTSATYKGNLGGLAGADATCNSLTQTNGLGGSWKAVLSDGSISVASRIPIIAPIYNLRSDSASGPQLIAANSTALWSGTLDTAVGYSELGIATTDNIWSGSNIDGTSSTNHCSNWTATTGNGEYGVSNTYDNSWLAAGIGSCNTNLRLYCVSTSIDPCANNPTPGTLCAGGVYSIGTLGSYKYMTTPGNCTNSTTPTCNNTTDSLNLAWANTSGTSAYGIVTTATSTTDGLLNTNILSTNYTDTDAAKFCQNMVYGGYSDWYLPATSELNIFWTNRASLGNIGLDVGGTYYWSSTDNHVNFAWEQRFTDANLNLYYKFSTEAGLSRVRCVRRY
jgi:hypothetical protein